MSQLERNTASTSEGAVYPHTEVPSADPLDVIRGLSSHDLALSDRQQAYLQPLIWQPNQRMTARIIGEEVNDRRGGRTQLMKTIVQKLDAGSFYSGWLVTHVGMGGSADTYSWQAPSDAPRRTTGYTAEEVRELLTKFLHFPGFLPQLEATHAIARETKKLIDQNDNDGFKERSNGHAIRLEELKNYHFKISGKLGDTALSAALVPQRRGGGLAQSTSWSNR